MDIKEYEKIAKNLPDTEETRKKRKEIEQVEKKLSDLVKRIKEECSHSWEKVTKYDPDYSPRVDRQNMGANIFVGQVCISCGNFNPRKDKLPFVICYLCGDKMEHDRTELFGQDRVFIHKCQSCGHEYDTT